MKFQFLPKGARFEYQGEIYTKTGPMTAAAAQGGQRVIPRFAVLKPLDGVETEPSRPARTLDEAVVMTAFERFYGICANLLFENESDVQRARDLRALLEAARERFTASLDK